MPVEWADIMLYSFATVGAAVCGFAFGAVIEGLITRRWW